MADDAYGVVRDAMRRWGNVRVTEGGWLGRCPVHDDRQGSLLVLAAGDGRVELDCLGGGCDPQDVALALRLDQRFVVVPPPAFEDGPGWVWPGYVPSAGLTLIDAEEGVDVVAVALDIAARVSAGAVLPDGQQCQLARQVTVLTAPHAADAARRGLAASGADAGQTAVLDVLGGQGGQRGMRLPADLGVLQEQLVEAGTQLLIVDVMLICPHRTPVERALRALAELAQHAGIAVLAVRGASKRAGWLASRRAQAAVVSACTVAVHLAVSSPGGTMALVPVASESWTVMGGLQFHQAGRNRPVVWSSRYAHGPSQVIEEADSRRRRPASTGAYRFLQNLLGGGPAPAREVLAAAAAVGLAPRTVQRARRQLGVVATKTARGWELSLPKQQPGR